MGKCESCGANDREVHKCTIEKMRSHCNICCEQISLGRLYSPTKAGMQGAFQ